MTFLPINPVKLKRACAIAVCAVTALQLGMMPSFAGSCPADKVTTDAQHPGDTPNKDVTDTVIASTDLADEGPHLKDHKFRMRRLVIQPGGVVALHSHEARPAIIYIISGSIVEYASTCAVPIVHRAGDVSREMHTTKHWWKNITRKRVVLLSADIVEEKDKGHTM